MSVVALASWVAVWAVGSGPEVTGRTVCPSVAEVVDRLGPMVSSEAAFPSSGFVELVDVPGRTIGLSDVELRLQVAGRSAPLGVRRVQRQGTCSETADAVAVIAASWAGLYRTPAPSQRFERAGADVSIVSARESFPPPRLSPARTVLTLGTSGGIVAGAAGGMAPAASVEVGVQRARWGVRIGVVGTAERTLALGPGNAAWHRFVMIPCLTVAAGWPRFFVEGAAGPVLALTTTGGQGFALNSTDTALELGLTPSLRLGMRLGEGPVQIWLGESAFVWLRPHYVSVAGLSSRATLPRFENWLSAGLTVSFGA